MKEAAVRGEADLDLLTEPLGKFARPCLTLVRVSDHVPKRDVDPRKSESVAALVVRPGDPEDLGGDVLGILKHLQPVSCRAKNRVSVPSIELHKGFVAQGPSNVVVGAHTPAARRPNGAGRVVWTRR